MNNMEDLNSHSQIKETSRGSIQSQSTPNKRKRTACATTNQIEALIAHLEHQPFLASRHFSGFHGRENYDSGWRALAEDLNKIVNGAVKSSEQWITVWRDIKSRACSKMAKLSREKRETGNRFVDTPTLTNLERTIMSIVGPDYAIGTNCPDSMAEIIITQSEFDGEADIMVQDNEQNSFINEQEPVLSATQTPSSEIPTTSRAVPDAGQQLGIPTVPETSRAVTAAITTTEDQVQPRRNRNLNPRRSVAEQHNSARADFLAVANSNAESMRMLAAAAQQQAEAAKVQAEAAKMQAEASLAFAQAANKIADALILFV